MKRKRFLALVLGVMMCFTLLQGSITFAASGVAYVNASGVAQTPIETATDITSSTTTWNNGWYYVSSDVTISSRVTVSGTVNLILGDGYTLKASDGIAVVSGNSLTIWGQTNGTGRLEATSTNRRAGIGGNGQSENRTAGTITINGGEIYASSTEYGAAIGGGAGGDYANVYGGSGGTITINGGNVTAKAGDSGAGIGGGWNQGNGGTIKITGGTVTATGGDTAAGIGGGGESRIGNISGGNAGTIIIEGGNVTATGGSNATGIGSGRDASGGSIKITGGIVTANTLGGESSTNAVVNSIEVSGCPVIVCSGYKHNQSEWTGGILFTQPTNNWEVGKVFGNPTLDRDLSTSPPLHSERSVEVPTGSTLTISKGASFSMGGSGYIVINGTVVNDGNLKIGSARIGAQGKLVNNGTVNLNSGWDGETSTNDGTITNNGTLYSNLNLTNNGTITNGDIGLIKSNRPLTGTGSVVNGVKFNLKYITTTTGTTLTHNNTDFTATLTADDNYILPETITVKVGGQEFTAHSYTRENPTITIPAENIKGNIEIIAEVATEIVLTKADVFAQFTDTENATLIVASYADKALKDAKTIQIKIGAYENTLAEIGLNTEGADSIKAFLWTDMTTLTPLCESQEVTLTE